MNRLLPLVAMLLVLSAGVFAQNNPPQNNPLTDSLNSGLEHAKTPREKVIWLGGLAQFYMPLDRQRSDEYVKQQQEIAEGSRDRRLMVTVLLMNARRFYNLSGNQDNINKGLELSQKALDLAKDNRLDDETAWSYTYLSSGARSNGDKEKALNYSNLALSLATNSKNDSLKTLSYISLAASHLVRDEKMLAFRNYLLALDIAEHSKSYSLQRACYNNLANFYSGLGDFEKAKDYAFKALQLTVKFQRKFDRLETYNLLGRIYSNNQQLDMATVYYDKSIALADTLKFELVKLNTYGAMLEMYIGNGKMSESLKVLKERPQLMEFLVRVGFDQFVDQAYGVAYTDMGKYDSALYYLNRAETKFEQRANRGNLFGFYVTMAKYYEKVNDSRKSLDYLLKAKSIGSGIGDIRMQAQIAFQLDSVYQKLGDFKSAYLFNREANKLKDSLETLSTEKDLMLMEVDNENKRKERAAVEQEESKRHRHNIQYMGITAAITVVFIVLVMLGIFSVSRATIRILGFFAFIFLFEFIILLADNEIHHWTHGEPWKVLLIKIGLISVLLPLHHFLEEKVIHYLTSKKLIELNKTAVLSRFLSKKEAHGAEPVQDTHHP